MTNTLTHHIPAPVTTAAPLVYPIALALDGKECLVVGGGEIAEGAREGARDLVLARVAAGIGSPAAQEAGAA